MHSIAPLHSLSYRWSYACAAARTLAVSYLWLLIYARSMLTFSEGDYSSAEALPQSLVALCLIPFSGLKPNHKHHLMLYAHVGVTEWTDLVSAWSRAVPSSASTQVWLLTFSGKLKLFCFNENRDSVFLNKQRNSQWLAQLPSSGIQSPGKQDFEELVYFWTWIHNSQWDYAVGNILLVPTNLGRSCV